MIRYVAGFMGLGVIPAWGTIAGNVLLCLGAVFEFLGFGLGTELALGPISLSVANPDELFALALIVVWTSILALSVLLQARERNKGQRNRHSE